MKKVSNKLLIKSQLTEMTAPVAQEADFTTDFPNTVCVTKLQLASDVQHYYNPPLTPQIYPFFF